MLSCAPPAGMPPAHAPHAQPWAALLQPPSIVKSEPMEEGSFSKEQTSGFYSDGFHSASPSSSSKDSNGHSPRSVGSGGETLPFYDNMPLKAKANLGMHLESYRNGVPYSLLTPPGFETRNAEGRDVSPGYSSRYSPRSLVPPTHVSTPLMRPDATPPKSPPETPSSPDREQEHKSFERFHDSGFDGAPQGLKHDGEDGREGSGLEEDFDEEPGLRVPAVNSHGKVKTFKCKQCEFVAVTKLSFWEHSKEHIKPEKMLCCRKCPFVTEYKHHLEYHMRNHLGSKPFQCSQCSYSCVNKSMLNSHLKSHSNVYQYRCADCNYATKYCHSLKLHLRKYQHNPAMVLNMDGTPNPLPIIDVYGTRRGPKQKPMSKMFDQQPTINNNNQPPCAPQSHSLFGAAHFPVNLPYLPPLLPHSFLFPPNNNYETRTSPKSAGISPTEKQPLSPLPSILHQRLSYGESNMDTRMTSPPARSPDGLPQTPTIDQPASTCQSNDALDLTNAKTTESESPPPTEQPTPVTPTTALKNRRKGRAFKLQPAALRLQHEDERRVAPPSDSESDASIDAAPAPTPASATARAAAYSCHYCDITFGDLTMHTIHMGFHGYNDPFMCNKCGERSSDRVAFFIHLGRAQHA
ncbi:protein hunchback [Leguminivora glycinivorella]|uniref:protein hunchback n=1 Tax=Leguminivora glycinivorella TaxID=1035111 RepID=UPI00200E501B|nr:protein hunchback [Leguminivora glycinivorella]